MALHTLGKSAQLIPSELGIAKMLTGSGQGNGCLVTGLQTDLTYMSVGWEGGFHWASDCPDLVASACPKCVDGGDTVAEGLGGR